jgi:hypothetical protein
MAVSGRLAKPGPLFLRFSDFLALALRPFPANPALVYS